MQSFFIWFKCRGKTGDEMDFLFFTIKMWGKGGENGKKS